MCVYYINYPISTIMMNEKFLNRESSIGKDEKYLFSLRNVETINNTNIVTNGKVQNELVTVTKRCDRLHVSKTLITGYDQQTSIENTDDAPPVPIKIVENLRKAIENEKKAKKFLENMQELKMTIDRLKSQSTAINRRCKIRDTSTNCLNVLEVSDSATVDMQNTNDNSELQLDKLKAVNAALSNERNANNTLMNSTITVASDKYRNFELELNEKRKELEKVLVEKNDVLERLKESEIALIDSNVTIDSLKEETNILKRTTKEQRCKFNEHLKKLENQITEYKNALARKEQYIENLELHHSEESTIYKNRIGKLSAILTDMKSQFVITEQSYNKEMLEMRNKLQEKDNLIILKSEVIQQQNKTLNFMKEIIPKTEGSLLLKKK